MVKTTRPQGVVAGLGIRLLASGYDLLILFGLCFLAFIPVTLAEQSYGSAPNWIKGLLVLTVTAAYFIGFWLKGGATTGMRPWRLQVAMAETGDPLTPLAAVVRFVVLMVTWLALGQTAIYMMYHDTGHALFFLSASIPALSMLVMVLSATRSPLHDLAAGSGVFRIKK